MWLLFGGKANMRCPGETPSLAAVHRKSRHSEEGTHQESSALLGHVGRAESHQTQIKSQMGFISLSVSTLTKRCPSREQNK